MVDAELGGPGGGIGNIPMPLVEELEDWLNLDMEWIDPAGGGNGNGNAANGGGGLLLADNLEGDLGPPQAAGLHLPGAEEGNFWQQGPLGLLGGGAHFPGFVAPGGWGVGQQQVGPVAGVIEQQQQGAQQLEEMDVQPGEGGGGEAAAALAVAAADVDAVVAAEQQLHQLQQHQLHQQLQVQVQQQWQQLQQQLLQGPHQQVPHEQLPALPVGLAAGPPPGVMQDEQQQLQQPQNVGVMQQQQQQLQQGPHEQLPAEAAAGLLPEVMQQQQQMVQVPPAADQLQGLQGALMDLTAALNMHMEGAQGAGLNNQQQLLLLQEAMAHAAAAHTSAQALVAAAAAAANGQAVGPGDALIATTTAAAIAAAAEHDSLAGPPAAAAAAEGGGQAGTSSHAGMGGPADPPGGSSEPPGIDMDHQQDIPRLVYGTDSEDDDGDASGAGPGAADTSDPGSDMDHDVPLLVDHQELVDHQDAAAASGAEAEAAEDLPDLVAHNQGPFDPFLPPAAAAAQAEPQLAAPAPVAALQAALAAAMAAEQEGDLGPPNPNNTLAALNTAAAAAPPPPQQPLADAPVEQMYADVLRGLRGLRRLDVDVTGLCKAMRLSSTPLFNVCELQLHMLGAVTLPAGGLPRLPNLTHLEFYLPDERNWGEKAAAAVTAAAPAPATRSPAAVGHRLCNSLLMCAVCVSLWPTELGTDNTGRTLNAVHVAGGVWRDDRGWCRQLQHAPNVDAYLMYVLRC